MLPKKGKKKKQKGRISARQRNAKNDLFQILDDHFRRLFGTPTNINEGVSEMEAKYLEGRSGGKQAKE